MAIKFQLLPEGSEGFATVESLKEATDNIQSGGSVKWFSTPEERDVYYIDHPDELKLDVNTGVVDPFVVYQWDGEKWTEGAIALKGDTGDTGPQGEKGDTGPAGPVEVTYTTETTLYQSSTYIPHVQSPDGDLPLAPMMEIVLHAQNDQGYWQVLQQVQNQLTSTQALSTQLQSKVNDLLNRVAVLEEQPIPEPEPVYDMASGLTLHTPALLGLLGIEIGGIDLIGFGWTAPSDGLLVIDGAAAIGLLTPIWIAVNGVKADPSGTVVLQLLGDGQNGEIRIEAGDVITQEGMGNITFYKRVS